MPGIAEGRSAIQEEITEVTKKIQLLEGGRKAFLENSSVALKKNKDLIYGIREENKSLHRRLSDVLIGDNDIVEKAFHDRRIENSLFRNKSGLCIRTLIDWKICDNKKKLNFNRALTVSLTRRLNELKSTLDFKLARETIDPGTLAFESNQSIRKLQNQLDKAMLKFHEAKYINDLYEKIKYTLLQESLSCQMELKVKEVKVVKIREELKMTQSVYVDAQIARDREKAILITEENSFACERKQREIFYFEVRSTADQEKNHTERASIKLQRYQIQDLVLSRKAAKSSDDTDELEEKLDALEQWFDCIKDASGISRIENLVSVFKKQKTTNTRLLKRKHENNKLMKELQEKLKKLRVEHDVMQCYDEPIASRLRKLDVSRKEIGVHHLTISSVPKKLPKASNAVFQAKFGIQHLMDKLQPPYPEPITALKFSSCRLVPDVDDSVLDSLRNFESKVVRLSRDSKTFDGDSLEQKKLEEEFLPNLETNVPSYNVRVRFRLGKYDDSDDGGSGDDDNSVPTRQDIRQKSQQILNLMMKKGKLRRKM